MLKNDWCVMFDREVEFIAMVVMRGGGEGVSWDWIYTMVSMFTREMHIVEFAGKLEISFYLHSYSEVCAPGKVFTETGRNEKKIK